MYTVLLIVLILLLVGTLPSLPYMASLETGYYPSLALLALIVAVLFFARQR